MPFANPTLHCVLACDPVHTGEVVEIVPRAAAKGALDSHVDTLDVGTKHVPFHLEPRGSGAAEAIPPPPRSP